MTYILLRDVPIAILAYVAYVTVLMLEAWIETEHDAITHFGYYVVIVALFAAFLDNHRPLFSDVRNVILANSLNVLLSAFGTVLTWMVGAWIYVNVLLTYSQ